MQKKNNFQINKNMKSNQFNSSELKMAQLIFQKTNF